MDKMFKGIRQMLSIPLGLEFDVPTHQDSCRRVLFRCMFLNISWERSLIET